MLHTCGLRVQLTHRGVHECKVHTGSFSRSVADLLLAEQYLRSKCSVNKQGLQAFLLQPSWLT